jgi:phosphatidylethanolamine-binding protein (PEBP) family uncharacterized protein
VFTLSALSSALSLPDGASAADLAAAMEGSVVEAARLTGRYAR